MNRELLSLERRALVVHTLLLLIWAWMALIIALLLLKWAMLPSWLTIIFVPPITVAIGDGLNWYIRARGIRR